MKKEWFPIYPYELHCVILTVHLYEYCHFLVLQV